jgi:hypothetical protein
LLYPCQALDHAEAERANPMLAIRIRIGGKIYGEDGTGIEFHKEIKHNLNDQFLLDFFKS